MRSILFPTWAQRAREKDDLTGVNLADHVRLRREVSGMCHSEVFYAVEWQERWLPDILVDSEALVVTVSGSECSLTQQFSSTAASVWDAHQPEEK